MIRKLKTISINILVLGITIFIALLLMEGACRIVFDPIDYLKPEVVEDSILRHRIVPNSGGHDGWGFRNKEVPDQCDIIVIGGSNTYGQNATSAYSWPGQLGAITGKSVYNLAKGGYGPPQYFYLLKNKAIGLKPKKIICDFALGGNIYLTYKTVYNIDEWTFLRDSAISKTYIKDVYFSSIIKQHNRGAFSYITNWATTRSMFFRIFVNSSFIKHIFNKRQLAKDNINGYTIFNYPTKNISTGFDTPDRLRIQDINDKRNQEGLRLCLNLFRMMKDECLANDIDFSVVFIPTKESVYAKYIENNDTLLNTNIIDSLIDNERKVIYLTKDYFNANGIKYIDILPKLQEGIDNVALYSNNYNGHPNKNGYAIIAKGVADAINENKE